MAKRSNERRTFSEKARALSLFRYSEKVRGYRTSNTNVTPNSFQSKHIDINSLVNTLKQMARKQRHTKLFDVGMCEDAIYMYFFFSDRARFKYPSIIFCEKKDINKRFSTFNARTKRTCVQFNCESTLVKWIQ